LHQYADGKGSLTASPTFPDDWVLLMNFQPRYYGGIQNQIAYKGLELSFLIQFVKQTLYDYSTNNGTILPGQFLAGQSNQPTTVLNRWQKPGDVTDIGMYTTGWNGIYESDQMFKDGSYMRLKNLSVAYEFPSSWKNAIRLKSIKAFVSGQNVITITRWKGLDPETGRINSLPPLRIVSVGLQASL
jgi:TonB-dependent starch-binding outer membrane protein SusC